MNLFVENLHKTYDKKAVVNGISFEKLVNEILSEAVQVAETGMQSTKDLLATKGRASFLGERAKGHIDPGARSSQLMIKTVCESVIQK